MVCRLCVPPEVTACVDRRVSRGVVKVLKRGGGGEEGERCRLTAAWVRNRGGCNLISLLVVCTILVRCLIFVHILALFLFPSFPKLYRTSSYSDFRVYLFYNVFRLPTITPPTPVRASQARRVEVRVHVLLLGMQNTFHYIMILQ
jgi:hypothetical protein